MIRIPTGPVSKNTARNVSLLLGIATAIVSVFAPQYADGLRNVGIGLAGLGLTLGKADS
jgi:hypothetical protein